MSPKEIHKETGKPFFWGRLTGVEWEPFCYLRKHEVRPGLLRPGWSVRFEMTAWRARS